MRLVVTKDDYFAAALDVLATQGHAALKIGSLCRDLGVTTGSFYHYFGGWDAFVRELLAHWEQERTRRVIDLTTAEQDPYARVRMLRKLATTLPHDAETAIRAWSHVNPAVDEVQRRVDQERLDALRTVIRGVVPNAREAQMLATIGMTLLVGAQQWRTPVDIRELGRMLDQFQALVLQHAPALAG